MWTAPIKQYAADKEVEKLEQQKTDMVNNPYDYFYIESKTGTERREENYKPVDLGALIGQEVKVFDEKIARAKEKQTQATSDYYATLPLRPDFTSGAARGAEIDNGFKTSEIEGTVTNWEFFTDEEKAVYNYLLATGGEEAAEEYWKYMQEPAQQRLGDIYAGRIEGIDSGFGRFLAKGGYALGAGVENALGGFIQATTEEELPTSGTQYGYAKMGENMKGLGKMAYDLSFTVGNMLPSMLLSGAVGAAGAPAALAQGIGAGAMGVSAGGNAYKQGLDMGMSAAEAKAYGRLIGASEGGLQYLLGGISALGGVSDDIAKAVSGIENGFVRFVLGTGGSMLSEASEEALQAVLDPLFQGIATGTPGNVDWSEVAYNALMGALMGGVFEAPRNLVNTVLTEGKDAMFTPASTQPRNFASEGMMPADNNVAAEAGNAAEIRPDSPGLAQAREQLRRNTFAAAEKSFGKEGYAAFETQAQEMDNPADYYGEMARAYNDGMVNRHAKSFGNLSEAQYEAMFEAGKADAAASITSQMSKRGKVFSYSDAGIDMADAVTEEYSATLNAKDAKALNAAAKAFGVKIRFADSVAGGDANAEIRNGVITIEKGNPNPLRFLFGHEITHRMQELAPQEYARLREAAAATGDWLDARIKKTIANYSSKGRSISQEAAMDEAIADYMGEIIESSTELERFIARFSGERTLLQKLRDVIRDIAVALSGSEQAKRLRAVEKRLREAMDVAAKQAQSNAEATKNAAQESDGGAGKTSLKSIEDIKAELAVIRNLKADFEQNAISIGTMPDIYTELFDISELDVTIDLRHSYNAMVTFKEAKKDNMVRLGERDDYHGLGVDGFAKAIKSIEHPLAIMDADKSGQRKNLRVAMILKPEGFEKSLFGVIELYDYKQIGTRPQQRVHALLSIYDKESAPNYVKTALENDRVLYIDKEQDLTFTPALQLRNSLSDSALKKNLARFNKKVNKFKEENRIDDEKEIARRVSNGESISATEEVLFSLKNDSKYMADARSANEKFKKVSPKVMQEAAEARRAIADIFNDPELADSLGLPPDIIGNTYIPNGSYSGTEENTTVCIRSIAADALMDAVAEYLGRPLTVQDTITISQELMRFTDKPECLYCYVAMDRKAHREFLGSYLEQRDDVISNIRKGMSREEAYQKFLDGRKDTKPMKTRFNMWLKNMDSEMITSADLASYANMEREMERNPALKSQINDALKYAQSASWAKKRVSYSAYNGHILKWKWDRIQKLNSNYGLRMYSFSDFSPAFILENMQMITDAAVRDLKVLAYTKELDFVRIFAKTGMNINISVFGYDYESGVAMDAMQGADWAEAQALRQQYPNVGCTFVATNDGQVNWALDQDWIDVIIPFHMVRTGSKVASYFNWKNYTAMSADTKNEGWTKADAKHILPPVHQNDKAKYLEACRKNHLIPRFNDWVEHPNYMKLVNETRRSERETKAVQPIFDLDAAKASIEDMRKRGGYYTPIGGSIENMQDIAAEIGDSIEGRFSLKDSDTLVRDIVRIQREGVKNKRSDADIQADIRAAVQEAYQSMVDTFGAIEPGENAYRKVQVPSRTAKKKKVSQTVRTAMEAQATPDEALPKVEEMIATGEFSYEVYGDKAALADGRKYIEEKGWANSMSEWLSDVRKGNVSKRNTAVGWLLYDNAVNSGDVETAMTILNAMVEHQRSAAQAVQATRILKKLSPETQLYGVQRSIASLQQEINDRHGEKSKVELVIDQTLAEDFMKARTDEERDAALREIYKDIGRQMPSTFIDKFRAWRYLAMLGNPRTHSRNVVGNAAFAPVVLVKDLTASAIEAAVCRVSGGKAARSKTLNIKRDVMKAAWQDYNNVADMVSGESKYSDYANANKYIEEGRQVFKFKPLEKARRGNTKALEAEDMWFSRPHYAFALAQYCSVNGIGAEQIRTGKGLDKAREYAAKEAQKATYRDTNQFSQAISQMGFKNVNGNMVKKAVNTALEGVLPFRKTPANILVRGVEYSPIGLMVGIKQAVWDVQKGNKTAAEAIDSISAGLTGTGLLALGVYLAAEGLIRGRGGDDEKEKEFEELMGHQSYALETPNGKSYTLDWLAPEALPFFIGVNLYENIEANREAEEPMQFKDVINAMWTVTEPMLEMSCLQSLNDLFEAVGYASSNDMSGLMSVLSTAATSFLSQALPTIAGQIERIGETERMTTYTEKNSPFSNDMQYFFGRVSGKTPGEFQQIPYIDAWGRTESTGGFGERAFNNLLNPAYASQVEMSPMEETLLELYKTTGEGSVLPTRAGKYFNVGGVRKDLTAEEYVKYATERGQLGYSILTNLVASETFMNMDSAYQAEAVSKAYEYANAMAKTGVSDYEPEGWVAKANKAMSEAKIKPEVYIPLYVAQSGIESLKDSKGETIDNSRSLLIMEAVYAVPGLNDQQRKALFEAFGVGKTVIHYNKTLVNQKLEAMRRNAR